MKLNEAARALVSGAIVYVVMAACSSGDASNPRGGGREDLGAGGAPSLMAEGGAMGGSQLEAGAGHGGAAGSAGGILDAMVNPVRDAAAQTSSGSRIKAKYLTSSDGAKQFQGWYDSDRQEDCSFQLARDGSTRCMPSGYSYGTLYSDTGCSQRLTLMLKASCGSAAPKYVWLSDATVCPATMVLFAVGPVFSGASLYTGKPGACTTVAAANYASVYDIYGIGAEIALSSFVAGTVAVE